MFNFFFFRVSTYVTQLSNQGILMPFAPIISVGYCRHNTSILAETRSMPSLYTGNALINRLAWRYSPGINIFRQSGKWLHTSLKLVMPVYFDITPLLKTEDYQGMTVINYDTALDKVINKSSTILTREVVNYRIQSGYQLNTSLGAIVDAFIDSTGADFMSSISECWNNIPIIQQVGVVSKDIQQCKEVYYIPNKDLLELELNDDQFIFDELVEHFNYQPLEALFEEAVTNIAKNYSTDTDSKPAVPAVPAHKIVPGHIYLQRYIIAFNENNEPIRLDFNKTYSKDLLSSYFCRTHIHDATSELIGYLGSIAKTSIITTAFQYLVDQSFNAVNEILNQPQNFVRECIADPERYTDAEYMDSRILSHVFIDPALELSLCMLRIPFISASCVLHLTLQSNGFLALGVSLQKDFNR